MGAKFIQNQLLRESKKDRSFPGGKRWLNPHIKYGNFMDHGYLVLTINSEEAQADYYHLKTKLIHQLQKTC